MKKCSRCQKVKPENEFNFKIKSKGIRQYHCRDCSRIYIQQHYEKNKEYYLIKAKRRNKRLRGEVRQYILDYLKCHPCVDCGENDPIVLEFDHLVDKEAAVSLLARNATVKRVQFEIEKCEVRCANCHRRKTVSQLNWHKEIMPL